VPWTKCARKQFVTMKLSGDATSPLVAAVTLVAKYCGVSLTAESTADAAPTLHTPQGPLVGAVAACTFLAEGSKVAAQLLGSDDATKAQVRAPYCSRLAPTCTPHTH
jgi:hypothetical protein